MPNLLLQASVNAAEIVLSTRSNAGTSLADETTVRVYVSYPVVHGQAGASRKSGCGLVPSPTGRYERELSTSCAISTKFTLGFTP
jgi:hypothetical protein